MRIDQLAGERFSTVEPFGHRRGGKRACDPAAIILAGKGAWRGRINGISTDGPGFSTDPMRGPGMTLRQGMTGDARCAIPGRTPPGAPALDHSPGPGRGRPG